MAFIKSAIRPDTLAGPAYYLCFQNDDVLIGTGGAGDLFPLLTAEEAGALGLEDACFIGWLNDKPCYTVSWPEPAPAALCQWVGLRGLYLEEESGRAEIAGYARQVLDWDRNFRFCGRCAAETLVLENEHARQCPRCRLINYPRISPATITAVIKDDQILLARGRRFSDPQMFSVLAGFLEPGESLEECVRREIAEEVGLAVTNVRYFKSQPWPFPDSLMIGFTADYQGGEIKIDEDEIAEAGWFKAGALPKVPGRRSLSSELIQWFVNRRPGCPEA